MDAGIQTFEMINDLTDFKIRPFGSTIVSTILDMPSTLERKWHNILISIYRMSTYRGQLNGKSSSYIVFSANLGAIKVNTITLGNNKNEFYSFREFFFI